MSNYLTIASINYTLPTLPKPPKSLLSELHILNRTKLPKLPVDELNQLNALKPIEFPFQELTKAKRQIEQQALEIKKLALEEQRINQQLARTSGFYANRSQRFPQIPDLGIEIEKINRTFADSANLLPALESSLSLANSYSKLLGSLSFLKLSGEKKLIFEKAAVELYNHASLWRLLLDNPEKEKLDNQSESLVEETAAEIEIMLAQVKKELVNTWRGVKAALESKHHDYSRHVCVSIRELLTHLLHQLAPDSLVKPWLNNSGLLTKRKEELLNEDRLTRKARLLFICRKVNHGSYAKFIEKDLEALLKFIELLQLGTHKLEGEYTHNQLQALEFRAESTIKYLINISWHS